MNVLLRFRRLPVGTRRHLPVAFGAVVFAGVFLRLVPFRTLRRWVDGFRHPSLPASPHEGRPLTHPAEIGRAVEVVSNRIPGSTCLVRAVAAEWILLRRGYAPRMYLGVARTPDRRLSAHAWIEVDGIPVVGVPEDGIYTPLLPRREAGAQTPASP